MARTAVVTGGSRGIGAAISKALKQAGYNVAANYGGNDEAAAKFKQETGIPVFRWDVSSYEACVEGLKRSKATLDPSMFSVNNAGITFLKGAAEAFVVSSADLIATVCA